MAPAQPFVLLYAPPVRQHLLAIERRHHGLIRASIESALLYEPDVESRNRKPLRQPAGVEAEWELRCGPDNQFRVFYSVEPEQRTVYILAIGVKSGSRLRIGRKEVRL